MRRMIANNLQCAQYTQWLSGSTLCARLVEVVEETMQPESVTLWLVREGSADGYIGRMKAELEGAKRDA